MTIKNHLIYEPQRGEVSFGSYNSGTDRAPLQINSDGALEVDFTENTRILNLLENILNVLNDIKQILQDDD